MEVLAAIFVICCVVGLLTLIVGTALRSRQRSVRLLLEPLVEQYGAELKQVGLWPEAVLLFHNVPVRVKVMRKTPSGRMLRFEAPINNLHLLCRIRPLKIFDNIRRWFGSGLLTGQGAFDQVFFVEGNDPDKLRETLDVQAQASLISLYSGIEQLETGGGRLRISAMQPAQLLVEHSLVLLERFLGMHSHGVEFLEGEDSGPLKICAESSCPVCGESVEGAYVVQCQGCHTPHHKECWKYAGGCAIYACGSRRQVKQRKR